MSQPLFHQQKNGCGQQRGNGGYELSGEAFDQQRQTLDLIGLRIDAHIQQGHQDRQKREEQPNARDDAGKGIVKGPIEMRSPKGRLREAALGAFGGPKFLFARFRGASDYRRCIAIPCVRERGEAAQNVGERCEGARRQPACGTIIWDAPGILRAPGARKRSRAKPVNPVGGFGQNSRLPAYLPKQR